MYEKETAEYHINLASKPSGEWRLSARTNMQMYTGQNFCAACRWGYSGHEATLKNGLKELGIELVIEDGVVSIAKPTREEALAWAESLGETPDQF